MEKLNTQFNVEDTNNTSSNYETIEREEIKNSPFTIITTEAGSWGGLGLYRLTEIKNTKEEVREEIEEITWNRIIQVIMLLKEIEKNEKKQ